MLGVKNSYGTRISLRKILVSEKCRGYVTAKLSYYTTDAILKGKHVDTTKNKVLDAALKKSKTLEEWAHEDFNPVRAPVPSNKNKKYNSYIQKTANKTPNKRKTPTEPPVFIREIQSGVLEGNQVAKPSSFTKKSIILRDSPGFQLEHIEQPGAPPPPTLKHGIDYALFQPLSFQQITDKRSGRKSIGDAVSRPISVDDFNYDRIPKYKSSNEDKTLLRVAKKEQAKFYSSSSAITGALSQIHFFLSNFRPVKNQYLTKNFKAVTDYAMSARQSVSLLVQRQQDAVEGLHDKKNNKNNDESASVPIYSISNDKSADMDIILSQLGHALETQLTTTSEEFNKYFDKSHPDFIKDQDYSKVEKKDFFHYSKISNFVLRSQLDSHHKDLPGSGVFDLKTRAVSAIRHDLAFVENNNNFTGYELDKLYGFFESYEREFYELSRLTLLKYGLQAQVGDMDGIFIAYHNISQIFGFQYLPLEDIKFILSSFCDAKFSNDLKKRQELLKLLYKPTELVQKKLYHSDCCKDISNAIMTQEYKYSFQILSEMLSIIQKDLKNCSDFRLVIKTFQPAKKDKTNDDSKAKNEKATLYFFAVPLESEDVKFLEERTLKDKILYDSFEKIDDFLNDLSHFNKTHYKSKLFGYKLTVRNHSVFGSTEKLPEIDFQSELFNGDNSSTGLHPSERKELLNFVEGKTAYKNINEWDHPFFFHPKDVNKWEINCKIEKIISPLTNTKIYNSLMDEKLKFLKNHITERRNFHNNNSEQEKVDINKGKNLKLSERLQYLITTPILPKNYKTARPSYEEVREILRALGDKDKSAT